jgi:hypothetical protein
MACEALSVLTVGGSGMCRRQISRGPVERRGFKQRARKPRSTPGLAAKCQRGCLARDPRGGLSRWDRPLPGRSGRRFIPGSGPVLVFPGGGPVCFSAQRTVSRRHGGTVLRPPTIGAKEACRFWAARRPGWCSKLIPPPVCHRRVLPDCDLRETAESSEASALEDMSGWTAARGHAGRSQMAVVTKSRKVLRPRRAGRSPHGANPVGLELLSQGGRLG